MDFKQRFKNVYFILGLLGAIFSASGVDFETLTSWSLLFQSLLDIVKNPFLLASVIATITGVLVNPTTRGFRDK